MISIDIANAFNTARHRAIWESLTDKFPGILRYYRMKHEFPAKMIGNDGETVAWMNKVIRGAGSSLKSECIPYYYSLHKKSRTWKPNSTTKDRTIQFYALDQCPQDDTQVRGKLNVIFRVAARIEGIFAQHEFAISVPKSKITGPEVENYLDQAPDGFAIDSEGLTALGVPVGSDHYRRSTIETKVKSTEPPAEALKLLRPRSAL